MVWRRCFVQDHQRLERAADGECSVLVGAERAAWRQAHPGDNLLLLTRQFYKEHGSSHPSTPASTPAVSIGHAGDKFDENPGDFAAVRHPSRMLAAVLLTGVWCRQLLTTLEEAAGGKCDAWCACGLGRAGLMDGAVRPS